LFDFDFGSLPENFVVKPNWWSMGVWISIVKRVTESIDSEWKDVFKAFNQRFSNWFGRPFFPYTFKVGTKLLSDNSFKRKLVKIIDGNYSSGDRSTNILVEEKLIPWNGFEKFCEFGLADIRVIVCNLVPVSAMIRVPTKKSWWKANLAQGGIGLWIDIATGKVKTLALNVKWFRPKYYDKDFPELYKDFFQFKIPFWSDILSYSANVQYFINMGFVWIDWVITESGPQLLEVNGKAGLAIQNISMVPLQKVLSKIIDLRITTPQKWVEIAKSLFSVQKQSLVSKSKVIYLSQKGVLNYKNWDENVLKDVIVEVVTSKKRNYISSKLFEKLKNSKATTLTLSGTEIVFKNIIFYSLDSLGGNRIKLWTSTLEKYYIKPIHKIHPSVKFLNPERFLSDELDSLQILDQKVQEINKKIKLSKILKPVNYLDEFDKFISKWGKYNPVFKYDFPLNEEFVKWETELKKLRDEYQHWNFLHSDFAKLFYEKIDELEFRSKLLKAYKKQDFGQILERNQKLYGDIDGKVLQLSTDKIKDFKIYWEDVLGKRLSRHQITNLIKKSLMKYKFKNVKIRVDSQMLARISISIGESCVINISPNAVFGENELLAKLEHEIGVHVRRFLAGKSSGWFLLSRWTAFYQSDEEGLAVYLAELKSKEFYPEYENQAIYQNYWLAEKAQTHNFQQLANIIMQENFLRTRTSWYLTAFNKALKQKKWIKYTKNINLGAVYFKWKAYLDGYLKVKKWVWEDAWNIKDLMIGKIKIDDLKLIL